MLKRTLLLVMAVIASSPLARAGDIEVISRGSRVDLRSHLVPGKLTLVDFYADWCGPCRQVDAAVLPLADEHEEILAVRKIDVVNWSSDVAQQYRITALPTLQLFDGNGEEIASGHAGPVLRALERRLDTGSVASAESSSGPSPLLVMMMLVGALGIGLILAGRRGGRARAAQRGPSPLGMLRPATSGGNLRSVALRPPATDSWFVRVGQAVEGPYTRHQLELMQRHGHLAPETPVRQRDDVDWRTLAQVTGTPAN